MWFKQQQSQTTTKPKAMKRYIREVSFKCDCCGNYSYSTMKGTEPAGKKDLISGMKICSDCEEEYVNEAKSEFTPHNLVDLTSEDFTYEEIEYEPEND